MTDTAVIEAADISAIVPTHNRAALLGRALRSVVTQTQPPAEVWVIDDGSNDATEELVAAEFPEVRYLRQKRQGVSAARNRGIAEAGGSWLAFLDSDDEWRPEKLARQTEALSSAAEMLVCHTDEIWIRNGRRVNPRRRHAKSGGWIFRECLPLCAISPSAALIHRSVFDRVGLFDEQLPACEDYDLWLRICCRFPVLLVDEPLVVKHGGHADQLSTTTWGLDRFRIRALEKVLLTGALSRGDKERVVATLIEKIKVYSAGAARRGRADEAAAYRSRLETLLQGQREAATA